MLHRGFRRRSALLALGASLAVFPGCVTVAEFRKLERDVRDLQGGGVSRGFDPGPAGGGGARLAELAARVDRIEQDSQDLIGRVEVAEHRSEQALNEARAARAGGYGAPPALGPDGQPLAPQVPGVPLGPEDMLQPGAPQDLGPAGAAAPGDAAEMEAYRSARAAWSGQQAETCIDRFRVFLQTYPASIHAESAAYWMADCYFMQGDYKTAILRFDDVVTQYPGGERAPDALYRQGEALMKLGPGYGKAAGKAFERVVQEYPSSPRASEARKQLELLGPG